MNGSCGFKNIRRMVVIKLLLKKSMTLKYGFCSPLVLFNIRNLSVYLRTLCMGNVTMSLPTHKSNATMCCLMPIYIDHYQHIGHSVPTHVCVAKMNNYVIVEVL